jgi:hypothetical protein
VPFVVFDCVSAISDTTICRIYCYFKGEEGLSSVSSIVTEKVPTCSGFLLGFIFKVGKLSVTKSDAVPRSIKETDTVSPVSGSVVSGNLYVVVYPK